MVTLSKLPSPTKELKTLYKSTAYPWTLQTSSYTLILDQSRFTQAKRLVSSPISTYTVAVVKDKKYVLILFFQSLQFWIHQIILQSDLVDLFLVDVALLWTWGFTLIILITAQFTTSQFLERSSRALETYIQSIQLFVNLLFLLELVVSGHFGFALLLWDLSSLIIDSLGYSVYRITMSQLRKGILCSPVNSLSNTFSKRLSTVTFVLEALICLNLYSWIRNPEFVKIRIRDRCRSTWNDHRRWSLASCWRASPSFASFESPLSLSLDPFVRKSSDAVKMEKPIGMKNDWKRRDDSPEVIR